MTITSAPIVGKPGPRASALTLLITVLRILLGAILLSAGIAKLTSFSTFFANVASYHILPMALVKPISYLLVSAEITLGAALSVGYFSRGAGLLASLLFLIFTIAMTVALWGKLPVDSCGCANLLFTLLDTWGLSIPTTPNWKAIIGDVVLAGGSFGIACAPQQGYGVESLIR